MDASDFTHGGRRPGAGHPKGDSKRFNFRASGEVARYIESHPNKSQLITNCVRFTQRYLEREPDLSKLGMVYEVGEEESFSLPYFEVKVVAGFPVPLDNDEKAQAIDLIRMLCPHPLSSYLIRVEGDSMIEADIHSGDILIIDKSERNPTEHQAALCELNGEYTIKFVHRRGDQLWLIPANPDYPEIPVKEGDSFNVWGVVTYTIHKPRP